MSARQVAYSQLTCDGCGVVYEHIGKPVAALRELAAKANWKHRQARYEQSNWSKQIDLCATCEEPKERP